jgi:hypothetical protein
VGVVSLVVVFVAAIGYLVLPGMLNGMLGDGCVDGAPAGQPAAMGRL